jgi:hypothetical protein
MESYGIVIATGIVAGIINRWLLLRSDYRHYPTYPHGQLIHLALGFIAASLGAVAVPAIAKPDYVAVTNLLRSYSVTIVYEPFYFCFLSRHISCLSVTANP